MFDFKVKRWAEYHDLLGPFQRRLSGFGLTLMVIFYLQQIGIVPNLQVDYNSTFNTNKSVLGKVAYDFSRHVIFRHILILAKPYRVRELNGPKHQEF
jgi:hypothetical protein